MNYQKIVCWGDSQSFGARTYGCYPLYLVKELNKLTNYTWSALNLSTNGHTARDLWFRLNKDLTTIGDTFTSCILIGANDVSNSTSVDIFEQYYRQILDVLEISGMKAVYCGEIPEIWPDGHAYFPKDTNARRDEYNKRIRIVVDASRIAQLVEFPRLTRDCFVDPVHFNEAGNVVVAEAFAASIIER